tara:strand:+ start:165 stop:383 length:219 start_codon:yes stop_codon:yes gene_type:complete
MLTITYEKKQYKVLTVKNSTFSFGGGLTVIDEEVGLKITCENGEVFYHDQDAEETYLATYTDQHSYNSYDNM